MSGKHTSKSDVGWLSILVYAVGTFIGANIYGEMFSEARAFTPGMVFAWANGLTNVILFYIVLVRNWSRT